MVLCDLFYGVAVDLLNSQHGCRVVNVARGGVFQADDVTVMTLTVNSIQNLLYYL